MRERYLFSGLAVMFVVDETEGGSMIGLIYWASTGLVAGELGLGGVWDVLRLQQVQGVVTELGYPSYFLVILGTWKLLGALALLAPRFPRLKEWAYAGVVFADSGAIVSHLWTGRALGELPVLTVLLVLTGISWASRPPSRRLAV